MNSWGPQQPVCVIDKPKTIAIFGAGGFGREVAMLIEQINQVRPEWDLVGYFDDDKPVGVSINQYQVLGGLQKLNTWPEKLAVVFALGHPKVNAEVVNKLQNPKIYFPILVHPTVIMGSSKHVTIGQGSIICAGSIITTNVHIGRHVILNLSCTVGHDAVIGDFCSFMPGCNISGEVTIGSGSFWGTGAKMINRKKVGAYTVIGAGAVVTTDIPGHSTAVGVPAKVIKR